MSSPRELTLEGPRLRVRFFWSTDRYAHEITWTDRQGNRGLLSSIEGTPIDHWPASPPLQSVSREQRGDNQLALLVGMAGHSHWSLSVELDPLAGTLNFDVACRVRETEVGVLGSVYHSQNNFTRESLTQAVSQRGPSAMVSLIESGELTTSLETRPDRVAIRALGGKLAAPATIRWAYRFALLEPR